MAPFELVAQVDERFLDELRVGQTATVVADAFPGERFGATLHRIAPRVDAQRGAVDVVLRPEAAPPFLREDMTLAVAVVTARRERAVVMPLAALRAGNQAWVAHEGRVQARALRLGLRSDTGLEVLEGLSEGEQVLLGDQASPGQRVRAVAVEAAALRPEAATGGAAGAAMTQAMGR